jgi:hypothetical protein
MENGKTETGNGKRKQMASTPFIIYTYRYDETSGGALLLHYLCHYLNEAGYKASVWHTSKPLYSMAQFHKRLWYDTKFFVYGKLKIKSVTNRNLLTPQARDSDIGNAIVVYPEVVDGNPLGAQRVVRWFLNKPGFFTGKINYGDNELHFYYQDVFNTEEVRRDTNSKFYFNVYLDQVFRQTNFGERNGTCFILRKGKDRVIHHDLSKGIVVDSLSNRDIASVFNRVQYCISYDPYTFYLQYAAICGCIPIVVPEEGVDKKSWQPMEELAYGIAYGEGDIPYAVDTRARLIDLMEKERETGRTETVRFAEKCIRFFA